LLTIRTLLVAAAGLAYIASAAAAVDGGLRLTPKEGDVRKYKLTAALKFQETDLTVTGGVHIKVLHVDDAGLITVQVTASSTVAKSGDQPITVQDSPALTEVFKPDGTLSELRGENASQTAYRMETLTSVKLPAFPLEKDKAWTWEIFPNSKVGIQKSTIDYKVLGDETVDGVDTWKVSRAIKELEGDNPATADGTVWINKHDGTLVKQVDVWKNAPIPNAPSEVDGTITLEFQP
jgi:hypothetical protein